MVYTLPQDKIDNLIGIIPEARKLNGSEIVIPLTLHNAQVLALLGIPTMSPLLVDYDFPTIYKGPRPHQPTVTSFKTLHRRNFDASDMRTGKSLSTLWAADYLQRNDEIQKALIVSPLSTLKSVWHNEIHLNLLGRRTARIIYGDRKERLAELAQPADFYIINFDGVGVGSRWIREPRKKLILGELAQQIIARSDINLIILDEASAYKNAQTDRWKIMNHIIQSKPDCWVWGLSGTTGEEPPDAWGVARLIYGPHKKPISYAAFRERTMLRKTEFKWLPRKDAPYHVFELLQPAIRYTRKDLGFPPLDYETRSVEMSPKQAKSYADMKADLQLTTDKGQQIDAVNEAALRTKLIQISCGMIYDKNHVAHSLDPAKRLAALDDILDEAAGKVIVFAPLTSVVNMVYLHIHRKAKTERVNGEVAAGERARIFAAFQNTKEPRVLVADPRTMAHGLNLTAADTIVWFGPCDSLEIYQQANARIDGPGQTGVVIHLSSTPVEKEMYRQLQAKERLQGTILALLRGAG